MTITEEIKLAKQNEAYHRKKMEYFKEELKILEEYEKRNTMHMDGEDTIEPENEKK